MKTVVRMLAVWAVVCAGVAYAASFDCKLAKTREEKAICSKPALSALDDQMSAAYKAWSAAVPEANKAEVLADQREWVVRRTAQCQGGTLESLVTCLGYVYQDRVDELKGRVVTMGGVQFVGRSIVLKAKDDPADGPQPAGTEEVPGYGVLVSVWPMALSDAPEWKKWNAAVEMEARKIAANTPDNPNAGAKGWSAAWAKGADSQTNSSMMEVTAGRVSAELKNYYMAHGGAHGDRSIEKFHWILTPGRVMTVEDVFKPGSGWATVLAAKTVAGVTKQMGADGVQDDLATQAAAVVKDPQNWSLTKAGLVLSYPEYTVSSYANPADDVTVSWADLAPFLAQGFVVPQ